MSYEQQVTNNEVMRIFDTINIRDIILDSLAVSKENVGLFLDIADDGYIKRRFSNLTLNDVSKIIERIDESIEVEQSSMQYDFKNLCILYSNIKSIFGDKVFTEFVNKPLSKMYALHSRHTEPVVIENAGNKYWITSTNTWHHPNGLLYFTEITFKLITSYQDITNKFTSKQQSFLHHHNIKLDNFNRFRFQAIDIDSDNFDPSTGIKYEILPMHQRNIIFAFGFTLNPKPQISTIPVWSTFKEFRTNSLLPSIERIFILRNTNDNDEKKEEDEMDLHIDHKDEHKLNKIWIVAQKQNEFIVNIKCISAKITPDFELTNFRNKCNVKCNLFSKYPAIITQKEIKFIQKCTGNEYHVIDTDDDCIAFAECIIGQGLIHVVLRDMYYFFKMSDNSKLSLHGVSIRSFPENQSINIRTSDIPLHWEIFEIGGPFNPIISRFYRIHGMDCEIDVFVEMDSFSDNILEFSITNKFVNFECNMEYDQIPNQLKIIRLSFDEYEYIMGELPFLINKELTATDLPFKPVEFHFYEMLFSDTIHPREIYSDYDEEESGQWLGEMQEMDEDNLVKLLNPVFDTKFDDEIIVFHR